MIQIRRIEMGVGEGASMGQWWTEFVDIPRDTPEADIEEAAIKAFQEKYRAFPDRVIGLLEVYWIPEISDEMNPRYHKVLRDIYASELGLLALESNALTDDIVMIPEGSIVEEDPEGGDMERDVISIIYDHPEYLLVGDVNAYVNAEDLEEIE